MSFSQLPAVKKTSFLLAISNKFRPFLFIKLGFYWYCKLKSFINCQIFLPIGHPKSQPFFDRVYTFSLIDDKIWFRHYQVLPEEDGSLAEIGPRFVLNPIKIFDASFSGATLWESPNFTTPAKKRALLKKMKAGKYIRYAFLEYIGIFSIARSIQAENGGFFLTKMWKIAIFPW